MLHELIEPLVLNIGHCLKHHLTKIVLLNNKKKVEPVKTSD